MRDRRGAPARGRACVRPGATWRRALTSGPSQDATLASCVVGLTMFRTAQLLPETARAASVGIGLRTEAACFFAGFDHRGGEAGVNANRGAHDVLNEDRELRLAKSVLS